MKDRIPQFLAAERLTTTTLADKLGVQRSGISHILSGRNKPSFDFIEKMLLIFPRLSADWLITGNGSMYKDNGGHTPQPTNNTLFEAEPAVAPKQAPAKEYEPVKPEKTVVQALIQEKEVEQVAIFYTDNTVKVYKP
ncbi:MAG: helix-turn-helix domain-containing protein [Prevotellaceae bacterium]|jgi:transcriptional regulator with XRE-family HTH domain|nr:helix-turn-helix domain-containing protein [Prevotellaceae bacterium]